METEKKVKTLDMTQGGVVKAILLFSIPLLIGNIFRFGHRRKFYQQTGAGSHRIQQFPDQSADRAFSWDRDWSRCYHSTVLRCKG